MIDFNKVIRAKKYLDDTFLSTGVMPESIHVMNAKINDYPKEFSHKGKRIKVINANDIIRKLKS